MGDLGKIFVEGSYFMSLFSELSTTGALDKNDDLKDTANITLENEFLLSILCGSWSKKRCEFTD